MWCRRRCGRVWRRPGWRRSSYWCHRCTLPGVSRCVRHTPSTGRSVLPGYIPIYSLLDLLFQDYFTYYLAIASSVPKCTSHEGISSFGSDAFILPWICRQIFCYVAWIIVGTMNKNLHAMGTKHVLHWNFSQQWALFIAPSAMSSQPEFRPISN